MVLERRLDYGFNGYQLPPTPRATRSARRRCTFKKKHGENQMCAFDLLAVVAGNLLLDGKNTPSSSNTSADKDQHAAGSNVVKKAAQYEEKPLKVEARGEEAAETAFVSRKLKQIDDPVLCANESLDDESDLDLGLAPAKSTSDCTEKLNVAKVVDGKNENEIEAVISKVEACTSMYKVYNELKLEDETESNSKQEPDKFWKSVNGVASKKRSSEDLVNDDEKPPALGSFPDSLKLPSSENHVSHGSYPVKQDNLDLVSRDDDENSYRCAHPISSKKTWRPGPRIGDRRIRKILASKYWKVPPRVKENSFSNADGDSSTVNNDRRNHYKCQRPEWIYPFKKRKHFNYSSPSNSDEEGRNEFASNSPLNSNDKESSSSMPKAYGANVAATSIVGQNASFKHRDSQVKLRIKSFRVPELFIEVPENATVGSLKRSVMDAVTAILGGGLRVGVLLQGKKVRDDNKTLAQTGIANGSQLDALGFSLEPNKSNKSPPLCPGDAPFLLPCNKPQPLSRFPATPVINEDTFVATTKQSTLNIGESDHESAPSPTDFSMDGNSNDSRALVSMPAMDVNALAMVPIHRKSKRPEIVQRRIRRPFSVAEVEALVQAVEKLGTGRWRDVKLCAFDNAKHRTYVDLKDKWKTLVHTARISPQQRRGEPVPQELLDRVLTAHAYWSQQQPKQQQMKQLQPQPESCLLLCDH